MSNITAKSLLEKLNPDNVEDSVDNFYFRAILSAMERNDIFAEDEKGNLKIVDEPAYESFIRSCEILDAQKHFKEVYSAMAQPFSKAAAVIAKVTQCANPLAAFQKSIDTAETIKHCLDAAHATKEISENLSFSAVSFLTKNAEYCLKLDNALRPHHIREPLSKYQKSFVYEVGKGLADLGRYLFLDIGAMALRDHLLLKDPSKDKWLINRTIDKACNWIKRKTRAQETVQKLDNFLEKEHPMTTVESSIREICRTSTLTDTEKGIQIAMSLRDLESVRAGNSKYMVDWGQRTGLFAKEDKLCHMPKEVRIKMLAAMCLGMKLKEPDNYNGVTIDPPAPDAIDQFISDVQNGKFPGYNNKDIEKDLEKIAMDIHESKKEEANKHREMLGLAPLTARADYTECKRKGDTSMDIKIKTMNRSDYDSASVMKTLSEGNYIQMNLNDGYFAVLKREGLAIDPEHEAKMKQLLGKSYHEPSDTRSFSYEIVKFNADLREGFNKFSSESVDGACLQHSPKSFYKDIQFNAHTLENAINQIDYDRLNYTMHVDHDMCDALTMLQNNHNELNVLNGDICINGHQYQDDGSNVLSHVEDIIIAEGISKSKNLAYLNTVVANNSNDEMTKTAKAVMEELLRVKESTTGVGWQMLYDNLSQKLEALDHTLDEYHEELKAAKPKDIAEMIKDHTVPPKVGITKDKEIEK
jgi:hypothetical protein